jgi:hypothetical protein
MVILPIDALSSARAAGLRLLETIKLLVPNRGGRSEHRTALLSARVLVDEAKMQVDHKVVTRAPGIAVGPLRRAITYCNNSINYMPHL